MNNPSSMKPCYRNLTYTFNSSSQNSSLLCCIVLFKIFKIHLQLPEQEDTSYTSILNQKRFREMTILTLSITKTVCKLFRCAIFFSPQVQSSVLDDKTSFGKFVFNNQLVKTNASTSANWLVILCN